jgi:hypothetical protein
MDVIASVIAGSVTATNESQKYGMFKDRIASRNGRPVYAVIPPGAEKQIPHVVANAPVAENNPVPFTRT